MVQHFDGAEPREWHLNQDLVFALGLLREGDTWVRPQEDYVTVARLRRDKAGKPIALEIKNEYLRDYLCARGHFLKIVLYRDRDVIVENLAEIGSPTERFEDTDTDRFELRVFPVLEGGYAEGGFAVFHVARTDVDPEEDVPVPGPETNENVEANSWQGERKGKRFFRVEGELWRREEIEPAVLSPRVRGDRVPTGITYIVDAPGTRMSSEELNDQDNARWLWFKPTVVPELLNHRGTEFEWYTRETGGIGCGPGTLTHFGLNSVGLVTVYAYDVAKLYPWQQRIWSGHNIAPEGGVSKELLSAQMRAVAAETQAPEKIFAELIRNLDPLFVGAIGFPLFRAHPETEKLRGSISRFRALERGGLFALAKDIMRLIADRIDIGPLQKIVPPPAKEKWGSLKSLEKYLATLVSADDARKIMGPLFGTYELRLADAHLQADELRRAYDLVGVDPQAPPIDQGFTLIDNVAKTIWVVGNVVHKTVDDGELDDGELRECD